MPLGQGWLNAWVKVNSKHVVFTANSKGDKDSLDVSHSKNQSAKGTRTNGSVATARTAVSDDAETQAIRRFNHRKHRRRLQRTVSASDVLRDKAKGKGDKKGDAEAALDRSSSTQATCDKAGDSSQAGKDRKAAAHVPQHEECSVVSNGTDGSLRFVAGFFGTDIESLESPMLHTTPRVNQSDSFIHDSASVQIPHQAHLDAASVISRGGHSLPAQHFHSGNPPSRSDLNDSVSKGGFRFPPNLFAGDSISKGQCRHCSKLENELLSTREDLEYLRGVALRSEYMCVSCQTEPSKPSEGASQIGSGTQMLNEVTARHKAQIEQLTKEMQRWQHENHGKLQKFAGLCKDLNEEADLRNEEALTLHKELDAVRLGRNEMATELEKSKALLAQYQRNEKERRKSELLIHQYEQKGLDGADRAVKTRDRIITDLSGRLERSLDCLELEREQQRQRRQIIFPAQRTSQSLEGRAGEEREAELRNTKDSLRERQSAMDLMKRDTERKEVEWRVKIENLERQVEAARSRQQY